MLKEMMERHRAEREQMMGKRRIPRKTAMTEEMEKATESMAYHSSVRRRALAEHNLALAKRAPGKLKHMKRYSVIDEDE